MIPRVVIKGKNELGHDVAVFTGKARGLISGRGARLKSGQWLPRVQMNPGGRKEHLNCRFAGTREWAGSGLFELGIQRARHYRKGAPGVRSTKPQKVIEKMPEDGRKIRGIAKTTAE